MEPGNRSATWGVLRRPRQELADQAARRKPPGKRGPGSKKPRWSAGRRASSIARGRRHASHACRVTSPATRGGAQAPAFPGAPLPSAYAAEERQNANPSGGLPRGAGRLLPHQVKPLILKELPPLTEMRRIALWPEPNVKQPLLGHGVMGTRSGAWTW